MGQTMAEKILSARAGGPVRRGEIVVASVDAAMATDTTAPLALRAFAEMGGKKVWDAARFFLVIDHAAPAPNERIANLHRLMREFAAKNGCRLYEAGEGICHQIMVEDGRVRPGDLFIGADSHTCTYGALGAFGTGVGSTDLAGVMLTGKIWLKVPGTARIEFKGGLPSGVVAKDMALCAAGRLGIAGATYRAVEMGGPAVFGLSLAERMTLANMTIEMGAKAGFVDTAGLRLPYEFAGIAADTDADYDDVQVFDASGFSPMVSLPHSPDRAVPVDEAEGVPVDYAFIGTCSGGRVEDLRLAAAVLKGRKVHSSVRLLVAPASRKAMLEAVRDGTAETLIEAGASFITPGCGPCVGTHLGVPGNEETVVSTGNRNFVGRMGNPLARIYLASPLTVAASAVSGRIADPRRYLKDGAVP